MKYAIMLKPNSNIPFFEELTRMCQYEAKIMFDAIGIRGKEMEVVRIGKGYFLEFDSEEALNERQLVHIGRLSFFYTLFEMNEDWMKPVEFEDAAYFTEDLSVRLKYTGKTNETFTRMMMNVALYSTKHWDRERLDILDPVSGKGTTLFEGLVMGANVYGAEKSKTSVNEMQNYLLRYLKEGRYKHQPEPARLKATARPSVNPSRFRCTGPRRISRTRMGSA